MSKPTRKERSSAMNGPFPRINVYICQKCHKYTVTVDVDHGVTPFMIGCQNDTTACHADAHSTFYPKGPKPARIPDPQWEWFKPNAEEYAKLSPAMRDHVDRGGLDIRKRTDKAPIMHESGGKENRDE